MPRNGSGTMAVYTPGNPVVTATTISSTVQNATNNDFATELTNSLPRDGQAPPTANLPMGNFKHTGAADATAAGQYLVYEQDATVGGLTATGAVDLTAAVLQGATPLVFEGATADAFELSFAVPDVAADVTVTLPNGTTTLAGLAINQLYTKAQGVAEVALTDDTTIAVDASLSNVFGVTLGGNRTLGQPTNLTDGQSITIFITQDGTGSRTLAYHADWLFPGGVDPTLSTAIGAVDILSAVYRASTTKWHALLNRAFA